MKRTATATEKKHLARVAQMNCVVCEQIGFVTPCQQVHHVRARHGWGRTSHMAVIPLCWEHHQGKTGVHSMGREQFAEMYGKSEIEMMDIINERLK